MSNSSELTYFDKITLFWIGIKTWCASDDRSRQEYSLINASDHIKKYLSEKGAQKFSWLFGPWVGTDSSRASLHHVGMFFMRNAFPGTQYEHPKATPPFTQGGKSGWLILKGPSNESWFDPWVKLLKSRGVKFLFNKSLEKLIFFNGKITSCLVANKSLFADKYVLAINPYTTKTIIDKTPELLKYDKQLQLFEPLVDDPPHIQISFRIAFSEKINFYKDKKDRKNGVENAVILTDSEFDITLFPQDELWNKDVYLGDDVMSLWSGTATIDSIPGKLYGLTIKEISKEQFKKEIIHQIFKSKNFLNFIMNANNGRHLETFHIKRIEVWHTWDFQDSVRDPQQPKWVNNSRNTPFLPSSNTSIPNLYLAGAHTKTNADLYSMEAAVESGKRVADLISGKNTIIPQSVPLVINFFRILDSLLYKLGLPNILYVLCFIVSIFIVIKIILLV